MNGSALRCRSSFTTRDHDLISAPEKSIEIFVDTFAKQTLTDKQQRHQSIDVESSLPRDSTLTLD
jgi:hypothetical protein